MFFSKTNNTKTVEKSSGKDHLTVRSALRFAFAPDLSGGINPMRESTAIFINLLAIIFISQGMFPADHPAYLGTNGQKLTLRILISTLWQNLKFTREDLPKTLMFFTLIASLVMAALAMFSLFLALLNTGFIHKAHAQGYFTTPAGDDIGQEWLDFLRAGDAGGGFFSFAEPLTMAVGIQAALVQALGFYSHAVLVIAAVILFYHLSAMVVETAHHGVVMGKKADQIWAPIRLVVAIGLLVPVGGGLNSGQYIVFKMCQWGNGLASNLWDLFLAQGVATLSTDGVVMIPEYAADAAYNAYLTATCNAAYDAFDNGGQDSTAQRDPAAANATQPGQAGSQIQTQGSSNTKLEALRARKCGSASFNQSSQGGLGGTSQYAMAQGMTCFNEMKTQMEQTAKQDVKEQTSQGVAGQKEQGPPQKNDGQLDQAVSDYMDCLIGGLPPINLLAAYALTQAYGWMSAGAFLSAVSQAEADANDLGAMYPNTQAPDERVKGDAADSANGGVNSVMQKTAQKRRDLPEGGGGGGGVGQPAGWEKCTPLSLLIQQATDMKNQGPPQDHYLDRVFELIDWLAQWNCVWSSLPGPLGLGNFSMGIMFVGVNPLAEMARLGQACINTAYQAFDIMVNLAAGKGVQLNGVAGLGQDGDLNKGAMTFINTVLGMICSVFFTSGILLAYYVPLIPFIVFLFGVMSWVLAVLEAVIAIPLLALAHLTVQGEGLPGAMARAGYFFLLNIALRPALMTFGLIVGILVFFAAISYMNLFYELAISTAGGLGESHVVLSRIVYNGIYVIICYIAANASFKAINAVPNHALKWMSSTPYHFEHMGDPQQVSGPLMQGAGNISQVTSGLTSGGGGAGKLLTGSGNASLAGNVQQAMAPPKG